MDMTTLKNASIQQDHIISPLCTNDNKLVKPNEGNIALTASHTKGKFNRGSHYAHKGRHTYNQRGSYNREEQDANGSNDSKDYNYRKPRYTHRGNNKRYNTPYCYICNEQGHHTKDCSTVKDAITHCKDKGKAISTSSVKTLFTSTSCTMEKDHPKLRFLIDSGMTQHMTLYEQILQEITPTSKQISAAGNHILNAIGEGDTIVMDNLQLTNILLAPELQDSLLSIAAINDHGCDVTFHQDGVVSIKDIDKEIAKCYRERNLYYLQLHSQMPIDHTQNESKSTFDSYTFTTNGLPMDPYQLWHL